MPIAELRRKVKTNAGVTITVGVSYNPKAEGAKAAAQKALEERIELIKKRPHPPHPPKRIP